MAAVGFFSSFITGSLIAVAGFFLMEPLLRFFGSTDTFLPYAKDYYRFILLGTPFIMCCFTMNNQMRQQGNALLSMIGIASGAILNVALDPLLIFGFGMGIRGAGLATARQGLFFIPALFIGRALLGFFGIEIAQAVSDACAFLLSIPLTFPTLQRMGKKDRA